MVDHDVLLADGWFCVAVSASELLTQSVGLVEERTLDVLVIMTTTRWSLPLKLNQANGGGWVCLLLQSATRGRSVLINLSNDAFWPGSSASTMPLTSGCSRSNGPYIVFQQEVNLQGCVADGLAAAMLTETEAFARLRAPPLH